MREKPVSFKMKRKEIPRKNITELEKEVKAEIITKQKNQNWKYLKKIVGKKSRELNTERKIKKREIKKKKKNDNRRNESKSSIKYVFSYTLLNP